MALAAGLVMTAGAAGGVGRWTSHGPRGEGAWFVEDLAVDPNHPRTVYVDTWGGLFKTVNAGGRWRALSTAPEEARLVAGLFAIASGWPGTVYLALEGDENTGEVNGIFRSDDQGETWTGPFGWPTRFSVLVVDPKHPRTLYNGQFHDFGMYKSVDAGESWSSVGNFANVGGIAIDPVRPTTLYVTGSVWDPYYANGLFKSTDGGQSWSVSYAGNAASPAVAPSEPDTVYASSEEGVIRSTNGGETWRVVFPVGGQIVVDPHRAGTVYCNRGKTVVMSVDGGQTWRSLNTGLPPGADLRKLIIDPTGRTLHLSVIERAGVGGVYEYTLPRPRPLDRLARAFVMKNA